MAEGPKDRAVEGSDGVHEAPGAGLPRRRVAAAFVGGAASLSLADRADAQPPPHTREGASTLLDVTAQFGGSVEKACTEAERSGGPSAYVWCGARAYGFDNTIHLARGLTVEGGGRRATRFYHAGRFDGPLFQTDGAKRNGQWESTVNRAPIPTYDPLIDDSGIEFRNFSIVDGRRDGVRRAGMYLRNLDDADMANVTFGMLTGTALKMGADEADSADVSPGSGRVRECNFSGVCIYRCGSGSPSGRPDVPAFILQSAAADGDGSNQNYFDHFRFVYNEGRMLISGRDDSNSLRRTIFRDTQLHALADNASWSPSSYFPFDMVTIEGCARETIFDGVMVNGTKAGTAVFALTSHPLTGQTPKRLEIDHINVVNTGGDLVRVESCDVVSVEGTGLGSVGGRIINNRAGSGLSRHYVHEKGINSPAGKGRGLAGVPGRWLHAGVPVTP